MGVDISAEGLAAGRREAASRNLSNLTFLDRDAADIAITEGFDFITSFRLDPRSGAPGISCWRASVRPCARTGVYLCVDTRLPRSDLAGNLDHPLGPAPVHDIDHALRDRLAGLWEGWASEPSGARSLPCGCSRTQGSVASRSGQSRASIFNNYYVATTRCKTPLPARVERGNFEKLGRQPPRARLSRTRRSRAGRAARMTRPARGPSRRSPSAPPPRCRFGARSGKAHDDGTGVGIWAGVPSAITISWWASRTGRDRHPRVLLVAGPLGRAGRTAGRRRFQAAADQEWHARQAPGCRAAGLRSVALASDPRLLAMPATAAAAERSSGSTTATM